MVGILPKQVASIRNKVQTRDFCAIEVEVRYELNGRYDSVRQVGVSWRYPGDPSNRELGYNLALARALANAGKKIEKRMMGYVKHLSDLGGEDA